jgi:hypothetical protein
MPQNSDLVTDLPADFEVFGQAVDTTFADLKGGTTGQVLKKNSNTDMDFVWSADAAGMTNPMTTTGDTIYSSSGSTPARLGIGSTGQVLTVSGGVPTWATPAGGKILQVVTASTSTLTSITSTSLTDTGITATITPATTGSRILILITASVENRRNSNSFGNNAAILRGATNIHNIPNEGFDNGYASALGTGDMWFGGMRTITYLDSPATTSATTYKLQASVPNVTPTMSVRFQPTSRGSSQIILMEVGA